MNTLKTHDLSQATAAPGTPTGTGSPTVHCLIFLPVSQALDEDAHQGCVPSPRPPRESGKSNT